MYLHYRANATGGSYSFFENVYFTPAQQADPSVSGPTADPDHDGLSNAVEYALGLNPTASSGSPFTIGTQLSPTLPGHPRVLTLSFSVPTSAVTDATLQVQQGTNLAATASWPVIATRDTAGNWTTVSNVSVQLTPAANGRTLVTVVGSQPPPAFLRLKVTVPQSP